MLDWFQENIFEAIAVPLAGIAILYLGWKGKWGGIAGIILGFLVATAFIYGSGTTWDGVGDQVGAWIEDQVSSIQGGAAG